MADKYVIPHAGEAFASQGSGTFSKDVLRVGKFVHPKTKEVVDITQARLQKIAANTNKYLGVVGSVPFPDGHTWDAMANLGHWPGPFMVIGDRLFSRVSVTDPTAREKVSSGTTKGVSAVIEFGKTDQAGNEYDEVITQVCATDYPVVTGQGGFVQLSGIDEKPGAAIVQESGAPQRRTDLGPETIKGEQMELSKIIAALGLPKDANEDAVMAKAASVVADGAKATESLSAFVKQATELGLKVEGDKLVKLESKPEENKEPEMTEREKAMQAKIDQLSAAVSVGKAQTSLSAARAQAEQFISGGIVAPAVRAELEELLAISDPVKMQALSAEGALLDKVVNVGKNLAKVFSHMQKPAPKGATALSDDQKAEDVRLEAKAAEMLAAAQPQAKK